MGTGKYDLSFAESGLFCNRLSKRIADVLVKTQQVINQKRGVGLRTAQDEHTHEQRIGNDVRGSPCPAHEAG